MDLSKPMIVIKIFGGLGNQLFQYAAGRSLAIANNCELKLDLSWFELFNLHNGYELGRFPIKAEIASVYDVSRLTGNQTRWMKALRRKIGFNNKAHFIEPSFSFCSDFNNLSSPMFIEGYWQSYKYFESVFPIICAELKPISPLSDASATVAEQILMTQAISIHVRRGDYVANQAINKVHGFIGLEYYLIAIQHIKKNVALPHFFVFSDDMEWAINHLGLQDNVTFVSHNTGSASNEDMQLMSLCKHNIIANSSFSWWGAWLNQNQNKMVIAPKRWFNNQTNTPDLIPSQWVVI